MWFAPGDPTCFTKQVSDVANRDESQLNEPDLQQI
jgi:hypothetical protein